MRMSRKATVVGVIGAVAIVVVSVDESSPHIERQDYTYPVADLTVVATAASTSNTYTDADFPRIYLPPTG